MESFNLQNRVKNLENHLVTIQDMAMLSTLTMINMMVIILMALDKEKVNIYLPMVIDMRGILKITKNMELAKSLIKIKVNIMVTIMLI